MVAMSQQLLLAFLVFAIVTLFTPGPNNVMLLSSGLNFGVRRTLPHVAGVTIGFAVMVAAAGLGFGAVFATYPMLQTVLKYAGAAYLVYLALAIGLSGAPEPGEAERRKPMTFLGDEFVEFALAFGETAFATSDFRDLLRDVFFAVVDEFHFAFDDGRSLLEASFILFQIVATTPSFGFPFFAKPHELFFSSEQRAFA